MKKRIVRLTESDLEKLVQRIIKEDSIKESGLKTDEGDLKIQTEKFFNKLNANAAIAPFLEKLSRANEMAKAQAVALFAEKLGLETSKLGSLVATLRQQAKDTKDTKSGEQESGEDLNFDA